MSWLRPRVRTGCRQLPTEAREVYGRAPFPVLDDPREIDVDDQSNKRTRVGTNVTRFKEERS